MLCDTVYRGVQHVNRSTEHCVVNYLTSVTLHFYFVVNKTYNITYIKNLNCKYWYLRQ